MTMLLNNDNESLTLAERMDEAIRNEFRDILQAYQEIGSIPEIGETGVYFRFDTCERGVVMPEHLFEAYPDELTIVLQNAFWGLEVWDEAFEVSLSFSGSAERIRVPFSSLLEVSDNAGFRHVFSSLIERQRLNRFLALQEVQDASEFDHNLPAEEAREAEMERLAEDGRLFWLSDFRDQ